MTKRQYLMRPDGSLIMQGYPISIERRACEGGFEHRVLVNGAPAHDWNRGTLAVTKILADVIARDIDDYEGTPLTMEKT